MSNTDQQKHTQEVLNDQQLHRQQQHQQHLQASQSSSSHIAGFPISDIDNLPPLTEDSLNKPVTAGMMLKIFSEVMKPIHERLDDHEQRIKTLEQTTTSSNTEVAQLKSNLSDLKRTTNEHGAGLEVRIKTLETESNKHKTVSDNNLKYLVNLDRNVRRQNVCLFGVPEDNTDLTIEGKTASTDKEKCELILTYIGAVVLNQVTDMFRLGKSAENGPRPIKIKFMSSEGPTTILKVSKKLNDLESHTIYFKPDKTKAEIAEYKRMGKRKTELLQVYPAVNDGPPRVVLNKGILNVDGTEVDRFKSIQSLF